MLPQAQPVWKYDRAGTARIPPDSSCLHIPGRTSGSCTAQAISKRHDQTALLARRFCFPCIMQWSQIESRCPFCKARFTRLIHRRLLAAAQQAPDPGQAHLDGRVLEVRTKMIARDMFLDLSVRLGASAAVGSCNTEGDCRGHLSCDSMVPQGSLDA